MAAAECSGRRRFAVACGVLSRCVRAEAAAAAGGKVAAATATPLHVPHPPAQAAAAATMLLMPGADVAPHDVVGKAQAQAQLTIMYGGRVLVFDDVPADRATALVRVAAAGGKQDVPGGGGGMVTDVPVERKASLRRFMEKRRERRDARAPYGVARPMVAAATKKKGQEEKGDAAGCWLGLGITGGGCAP
ncbi:unnamed protein product [Urochloa humidicola]